MHDKVDLRRCPSETNSHDRCSMSWMTIHREALSSMVQCLCQFLEHEIKLAPACHPGCWTDLSNSLGAKPKKIPVLVSDKRAVRVRGKRFDRFTRCLDLIKGKMNHPFTVPRKNRDRLAQKNLVHLWPMVYRACFADEPVYILIILRTAIVLVCSNDE